LVSLLIAGDLSQFTDGVTEGKRGLVFGPDIVEDYLARHNIRNIIRGHQDTVNCALMVRNVDLEQFQS